MCERELGGCAGTPGVAATPGGGEVGGGGTPCPGQARRLTRRGRPDQAKQSDRLPTALRATIRLGRPLNLGAAVGALKGVHAQFYFTATLAFV